MTASPDRVAAAAACARIARRNENFGVGLRCLPRFARAPVTAFYAFARVADDFADETADDAEALAQIDAWEAELDAAYAGTPSHPVLVALADAAARFSVPRELPARFLAACRQDRTKTRYATFEELRGYCRLSADPAGRIVLRVLGVDDREAERRSDAICSALALANFWQDVPADRRRGRIYVPREDLDRFGLGEDDVASPRLDDRWRALLRFEGARTRAMLGEGAPLARALRGRARVAVRALVAAGHALLGAIESSDDLFERPPRISGWRKVRVLGRALFGATP